MFPCIHYTFCAFVLVNARVYVPEDFVLGVEEEPLEVLEERVLVLLDESVDVVDDDEGLPTIGRGINSQRFVAYPEGFTIVGEPLNPSGNVSASSAAGAVVG